MALQLREPIRVLIADDHAILRVGLRAILEEEGLEVVGEASDGQQAVTLSEKLAPDVVVVDVSMPVLNGIDAARKIRSTSPNTKIVVVTMYAEDHYILASLRAGVAGFVLKSKSASSLIEAIDAVRRGEVYLSSGVSRAVVDAFLAKDDTPADPLSTRERQVLQLIAEGKNVKEIAVILGTTAKTAEAHRANVMQKLHIHGVAGLVRYAIRQGLITPD